MSPYQLFRTLLVIPAICFSQPGNSQSDDAIQTEIELLSAHREQLEYIQDTVDAAIRRVDDRLRQLEFEQIRRTYGEDGHVAIILHDSCQLALDGSGDIPQRGSKVVVVGATRDGLWKLIYDERMGYASDACLRFRDRGLNVELLKSMYMDEAWSVYEAEQHRRDSIARASQARADSIEAAAHAKLVALAQAEKDRLDAIGKSNHPIRVNDVFVAEINSAGGVTMGIRAQYLKQSKRIKYIYFTFNPYNSVGDKIACSIRATSEFIGKVTGPVEAQYEDYYWFWENAWYNPAVQCIKIAKVKVEYTDGTTYTYVRELPKILGDFSNFCAF